MKKIIILFLLVLCLSEVWSQAIERKLISSAGANFVKNNYQLSFSLGEVVITPSPAIKIPGSTFPVLATIGFHQPHVAKTGVILPADNWVSVYPNPAVDHVRLDIHGDNFQSNYVLITNALGQRLVAPFAFSNGSIDVDISRLAAGAYTIAVTDKISGQTVTAIIIKQHN